MDNKWKVKAYESLTGDIPVEKFILSGKTPVFKPGMRAESSEKENTAGFSPWKFIKSLDEKAQLKISRTLDLLEEFGLEGAYPHVKKLVGTSLWELRILGSDSIRILYITVTGKIFLLLHGFKKKSEKTSPKEITIAQKRLNEYRSRKIGD